MNSSKSCDSECNCDVKSLDPCNPCNLCIKEPDTPYKEECDPCDYCCGIEKEDICAVYVSQADVTINSTSYSLVHKVEPSGKLDQAFIKLKSLLSTDLVWDRLCNLYISDFTDGYVLKYNPVTKKSKTLYLEEDAGPFGIDADDCGNLYIADYYLLRIYKNTCEGPSCNIYLDLADYAVKHNLQNFINPNSVVYDNCNQVLYISASNYIISYDGKNDATRIYSRSSEAVYYGFFGIALNSKGDLYFSDYDANIIYKLTVDEETGEKVACVYAQAGSLKGPGFMRFDIFDNLFVANFDTDNKITRIDKQGFQHLFATIPDPIGNAISVAPKKGPPPPKCW